MKRNAFSFTWLVLGLLAFPAALESRAADLLPVPQKLVVSTFDDSVASHHAVAGPLLKKYGFGATFFITEGFSFRTNKKDYLTWEQIAELHRDGFEIGNHTRDHWGVTADTLGRLPEQLEAIAARCREHGIPTPVTFAWPGNAFHTNALPLLRAAGIRFARRGSEPEVPYKEGSGIAYEPGLDHPLLIPSAGDARPVWTLEDFKRAAMRAQPGQIAVIQFHGVPEGEHPWFYLSRTFRGVHGVAASGGLPGHRPPGPRPVRRSGSGSRRSAGRHGTAKTTEGVSMKLPFVAAGVQRLLGNSNGIGSHQSSIPGSQPVSRSISNRALR